MPGSVIIDYTNGFAGKVAETPDILVRSYANGADSTLLFGTPVIQGTNGAVIPADGTATAETFVGFATAAVKTDLSYYPANTGGGYAPGEMVSTLERGTIMEQCHVGTPAMWGKVYLRIAANSSVPTGVVGGLETAADGANTVQLTNCFWAGTKDANGIAPVKVVVANN